MVCFGAGARGPGSLGLAPVVATAPFSTYKSPKFYLSFTILVSFILVRYPDRIGLVNTVSADREKEEDFLLLIPHTSLYVVQARESAAASQDTTFKH